MVMPESASRFQINPRLLWLLGVVALIVLGEGALRAMAAHQSMLAELASARARATVLAGASASDDWAARTTAANQEAQALRERLWTAPSQAQAQARLADWLGRVLPDSAAGGRPVIGLMASQLPPSQAPGAIGSTVTGGRFSVAGPGVEPVSAVSDADIVRVRAGVTVVLLPGVLEKTLVAIEGGGQLARIDALTVSGQSRQLQMTVSVPVLLQPQVASLPTASAPVRGAVPAPARRGGR
ncbi:MAG: hypothetical protein ABIN96_00030 [Rubrivivax sp.]